MSLAELEEKLRRAEQGLHSLADLERLYATARNDLQNILDGIRHMTTELRNQHEQLAQKESKVATSRLFYEQFYLNSPEACMVTNDHGLVLDVNKAAEVLLGVTQRLIRLKPFVIFVPSDQISNFYKMLEAMTMLRVGEPAWFNLHIQPKKNALFPAEIVANVTRLDSGELDRIWWTIKDRTNFANVEAELKRKIHEANVVSEQMEEFVAVTAHDLQEPARIMGTYARLLARTAGDKLDEESRMQLAFLTASADKMLGLVRGLSSYTGLGKITDFQQVDLNKVMQKVCQDLELTIKESGAKISVDNELPTIVGSAVHLHYVFENVLSNAVKFRKPDRTPEIGISSQISKRQHLIAIKDNGIGFNQDYAERIFGVFERLHDERQYPGVGIGLALCKKIIDQHDGQISAKSKPDAGTTIFIWLPQLQQTNKGQKASRSDSPPATPAGQDHD